MFTYRLDLADGSDAGEASYSVMIKPGEEILVGNSRPVIRGQRWAAFVPFS